MLAIKRGRHEEHAGDGEDFDDLVLLDVDEAQRGLQQEGHLLGLLVRVVVEALDVARDAAELGGQFAVHPGGGVVQEELQHAGDAHEALAQIGDKRIAAAEQLDDLIEVALHFPAARLVGFTRKMSRQMLRRSVSIVCSVSAMRATMSSTSRRNTASLLTGVLHWRLHLIEQHAKGHGVGVPHGGEQSPG